MFFSPGEQLRKASLPPAHKRQSSPACTTLNVEKEEIKSPTDHRRRTHSVTMKRSSRSGGLATDGPGDAEASSNTDRSPSRGSLHVRFYSTKPILAQSVITPLREEHSDSATLL
ncbi:hypothetical protein GCK32_009104 [Trichostrongylus colubriformis]|uniref:Uncharacterized protein n=1 Tax=Trichostrongylus colubriformis TaxID=6319 RepID=A0AAN8FKD9_TRICO